MVVPEARERSDRTGGAGGPQPRTSGGPEARTSGGLRARKKARTRALIQEQALRLFAARGYDETTAEQIAEAAEVAVSTLFRYFPTKADIVRYDPLDPILFDAYRRQPPDLPAMSALRAAARGLLESLPPGALSEQLERGRLVLSVPGLRATALDNTERVSGLFVEAEIARTGRAPDAFAVAILIGALTGAITVAIRQATDEAGFAAALDRTFALLEAGLPL